MLRPYGAVTNLVYSQGGIINRREYQVTLCCTTRSCSCFATKCSTEMLLEFPIFPITQALGYKTALATICSLAGQKRRTFSWSHNSVPASSSVRGTRAPLPEGHFLWALCSLRPGRTSVPSYPSSPRRTDPLITFSQPGV